MRAFYEKIVKFRKPIVIAFLILAVASIFMRAQVGVNYEINDYLPDDSPSTLAIDKMAEEFPDELANARVMVKNVTIPEALEYKEKLKEVDGVEDVTWLDDSVDIATPYERIPEDTLNTYYKDQNALFSVTVDREKDVDAVTKIRELVGEDNAVAGSIVNTVDGRVNTVDEINIITIVAVIFVLAVLLVSTDSWAEPFVVLVGLGVAIIINAGTNLIFGEISFVTNAAGNVLQLAVSLDYSVFLIHRFEEIRREKKKLQAEEAMVEALQKSTMPVLSSGITTVIGFLAVILMRFKIGPDVGLALAKGVVLSLLTTFVFMPGAILMTYKWIEKTKHRIFMPSFKGFAKLVSKITIPLCVVLVTIAYPAYLAYTSNQYYYGSAHLFGTETRLGRDTEMIESAFGQSDMYALLVKSGDRVTEQALSDELHKVPEVTSIISYVDTVGQTIPSSYLDSETYAKLDSSTSNHQGYSRMVLSVAVPYEGDETFALVQKIREIAGKYYPDEGGYYLAGNGVSTYDLKETITADMMKVNFVAIGAVFVVLLISLKSVLLPLVLILTIETAIAINLSFPYFTGETVFYVAYLIISSIQLGATVDYAILMTDLYRENRKTLEKKEALKAAVSTGTSSILVSGSVLTIVGFLMGGVSSNQLLAQLGVFIGRGALLSVIIVLTILPGFLSLLDRLVIKQHKNLKKGTKHA